MSAVKKSFLILRKPNKPIYLLQNNVICFSRKQNLQIKKQVISRVKVYLLELICEHA